MDKVGSTVNTKGMCKARRQVYFAVFVAAVGTTAGLMYAADQKPKAQNGGSAQSVGNKTTAAPPHALSLSEARAQLPQRLRELDSPSYEIRCRAAQSLEMWVGSPELGDFLAEEFQRRLMETDLPMEARWRLSLWQARLPKATIELPASLPLSELQRLVAQLDDDSFSGRAGASAGCNGWRRARNSPRRSYRF